MYGAARTSATTSPTTITTARIHRRTSRLRLGAGACAAALGAGGEVAGCGVAVLISAEFPQRSPHSPSEEIDVTNQRPNASKFNFTRSRHAERDDYTAAAKS